MLPGRLSQSMHNVTAYTPLKILLNLPSASSLSQMGAPICFLLGTEHFTCEQRNVLVLEPCSTQMSFVWAVVQYTYAIMC